MLFDSFQRLPKGHADDRGVAEGDYAGSLAEVPAAITRYGAIECIEFVPGWFDQTLPGVDFPIALLFLDVDLEASLDTCVRNLWPYLIDGGCLFTDEGIVHRLRRALPVGRWWRETFATTPPGMIGSGCGLPLGTYYVGTWEDASTTRCRSRASSRTRLRGCPATGRSTRRMAIFDERVLVTLADGSRRKEFRSAEPSRHVVIDGLFDDAALRELVRDFPAPDAPFWRRTTEARAEIKLASRRAVGIPKAPCA